MLPLVFAEYRKAEDLTLALSRVLERGREGLTLALSRVMERGREEGS
jgi:hypothetical protein